MHRPLVAISVASPILVGGLAAVLLAHALAHSWLWGALALAGAAALFGALIVVLSRSGGRHPAAWQVFIERVARARAGAAAPRSSSRSRYEAHPRDRDAGR